MIPEQVASSGDDWPMDGMEIAREISENHVVAKHYVDQLVRHGFLNEQLSVDASTYLATRRGRAYLVARGLV